MSKDTHSSEFYTYQNCIFKVNATKRTPVRKDILKKILDQLIATSTYHHKLFIFRFDLHIKEYTNNNKVITDFNRRLFKKVKRHYKVKRIGYVWVREQEKSKKQHYHYVLILDGSKVNSPHSLQTWISAIWSFDDGTCHWSQYYNISRAELGSVTHHLSYLAKTRGKGYRPPQTKDFGSSRIK